VDEVLSWVASHARRTPDREAVIDLASGRRFTYREFADRIASLARHLRSAGVTRGDRVAVLGRNSHHVLEAQYACALTGAVFVPLNWRLGPAELVDVSADCGPVVLLHEDGFSAVAAQLSLPSLAWRSDGGTKDHYENALAVGGPEVPPAARPGDPWAIIYTSGTTGRPKGVVVTHASSMATMVSVIVDMGVTRNTTALAALPFCHVAGLNLFTNPALFVGGRVVVMRDFDPTKALELMSGPERTVTHFCGVPAQYQFIRALPQWDGRRFNHLTTVVGGAPVPEVLLDDWTAAGTAPQPVYGISEAGAAVLTLPAGAPPGASGTVGWPLMHVRARIVDELGADAPAGQVGQLLIAGPSVTPGYWGNQAATAAAINDGWLHTGDAAIAGTDGRIRLVDRLKDMYVSGGENVYPAEIENVLHRHPQVAEAAVVGVPDPKWGECGHAFVVAKKDAVLDPEELRGFVRERLAGYKVPREVTVVETLPRNNTGKIMKNRLRTSSMRR
jgi:fatty-acyl-CoA synthase